MDPKGRAYAASFANLRRRLLDEEGELLLGPEEAVAGHDYLEAALALHRKGEPLAVLLPTPGELSLTTDRLLFLADAMVDRTEQAMRLNVAVQIPQKAAEHFFREGGGREFLEIPLPEVRGVNRGEDAVTVRVRAAWPAEEEADFVLTLTPPGDAAEILAQFLR